MTSKQKLSRHKLIRRFAVAIAGAHQVSDFRSYKVSSGEVWRIATSLADAELEPQPEPDNRIEAALQKLRKAYNDGNDGDAWDGVLSAIQILEGKKE